MFAVLAGFSFSSYFCKILLNSFLVFEVIVLLLSCFCLVL